MTQKLLLALILSLLSSLAPGCSNHAKSNANLEKRTDFIAVSSRPPITGIVMDMAPIENVHIELRLVRNRPPSSDTTLHTTTDETGRFSIAPNESGPYQLVAFLPGEPSESYSAYVAASEKSSVVVSPLSTVASGLTHYLFDTESICDGSIVRGFEAFSRHFLIADIAHTEPTAWDAVSSVDKKARPAGAPLQAALIIQGLMRLAEQYSNDGFDASASVSLATLSNMMAEDLRSDGVLDGLGHNKESLLLARQPYDGSILRSQLGQAILRDIDILPHDSGMSRQSYCPTATKIADSHVSSVKQSLFPGQFFCHPARMTVTGQVFSPNIHSDWSVDAWSIDHRARVVQRLAKVPVKDQNFCLDIIGVTGPLLIRAYPRATDINYYYAYVIPPNISSAAVRLNLEPLTTLVAAYGRALMDLEQRPLDQALQISERRLGAHLETDTSSLTLLNSLDLEAWIRSDISLDSSMRGYLVRSALSHMADHNSLFKKDQQPNAEKLLSLSWLLAEDVAADGVLDGLGKNRRPLAIEGYAITEETLRADLARSLLSLLRQAAAESTTASRYDRSTPSSGSKETQTWARGLATTTQSPFPATARPLITSGPSLQNRCYVSMGPNRTPLAGLLRGVLQVECEPNNGHFLSSASISAKVAGGVSFGQDHTNSPISNVSTRRNILSFTFDTRKITSIAEQKREAAISIFAEDTLGAVGVSDFSFQVDNTKPQIVCSNCDHVETAVSRSVKWISRENDLHATVEISGRPPLSLSASNSNTALAVVSDDNESEQSDELFVSRSYEVIAKRSDSTASADEHILLIASDGSGNDNNHWLTARWAGDGPQFSEPAITYTPAEDFVGSNDLSEKTDPRTDLFVSIHRYANHLDYNPVVGLPASDHPLPQLQFHLPIQAADALPLSHVEYRATCFQDSSFLIPVGNDSDTWRPVYERIAPDHMPRSFYLPIGYQTLLPDAALSEPSTAKSAIRMVLHNVANNGPSAWIIDVRAVDILGNSSTRQAKLLIHTKLPGIKNVAFDSEEWCQGPRMANFSHAHDGLAKARIEWPMAESPHSLFQHPSLTVDVSFPQPPVTTIEETYWRLRSLGKEISKKQRRTWEDQRARQCEFRTDPKHHHGIYIHNHDQCIKFPHVDFYYRDNIARNAVIPLNAAEKLWISTAPLSFNFIMTDDYLEINPTIWTSSHHHRMPSWEPVLGNSSGIPNQRYVLDVADVVVYKDGKRHKKRMIETIERAHTAGQIKISLQVNDSWLQLDNESNTYVHNISCDPMLASPWHD